MSPKKRITIVLEPKEGLIPLTSFRVAIEQLNILVNEVSIELSEPRPHRVSWGLVQLSMNSPAKISIESIEEETEGMAERIASTIVEGLTSLEKEKKRPKYFNDNALESAQRLARLTSDNLSRVNIYTDISDYQVYLTEQVAVNINSILEYLDYHGSVEGRLELISGREGQPIYFRVQDKVNNVGVRCYIPDNLLEVALSAFRKRVVVSGLIKSDNNGIPRSIRADNIEIFPDESLPKAEDVIKELESGNFKIQPYGNES